MVSVVMPAYNADKTLSGAIESILNQSYTDFEFIIVDDGSTDRSYEIMLKYARDDKRIKIVRLQQNQGISFARNAGLDATTRKYIAVMDADDISLPQRLQVEVDFLEHNAEFGLVVSNAFYVNEDMENIGKTNHPQSEITLSDLISHNPIVAGTAMFRSDCIAQVGKYATYDWVEDYELWIRFARQYKIKNLQDYLYKYRVPTQPKVLYSVGAFLQSIAQAYQQIANTIGGAKNG